MQPFVYSQPSLQQEAVNINEPAVISVCVTNDGAAEVAGLPRGGSVASTCDSVAETLTLGEMEDGALAMACNDNVATSDTLSVVAQEGFSKEARAVAEDEGSVVRVTEDHMTAVANLEAATSRNLAPAGLSVDEALCKSLNTALPPTEDGAVDGDVSPLTRELHGGVEAQSTAKEGESVFSGRSSGGEKMPIQQQIVEDVRVRDTHKAEGSVTVAALEKEGAPGVEVIIQEEETRIEQPTDGQPLKNDDGTPSINADPPAAVVEAEQSSVGDVVVGDTVRDELLREVAAVEGSGAASRSTLIADDTNAADEASVTDVTPPQTRDGGTIDRDLSGPDDAMHGLIPMEVAPDGIDATPPPTEDVEANGDAITLPREGHDRVEAQSTAKEGQPVLSGRISGDSMVPIQQQMVAKVQVGDEHVTEDSVAVTALEEETLPEMEIIIQEGGMDMRQPTDDQPLRNDDGVSSINADTPAAVTEGGESTMAGVVVEDAVPDGRRGDIAAVEDVVDGSTDTLNIGETRTADEASATDGTPPLTRGGDSTDPSLSGPNDTAHESTPMEVASEGIEASLRPAEEVAMDGDIATLPPKALDSVEAQSTAKEEESENKPIQHQMVEEVQAGEGQGMEDGVALAALEEERQTGVEAIVQEDGTVMAQPTDDQPPRNEDGEPSIDADPPADVTQGEQSVMGGVGAEDTVPDDILGEVAAVQDVVDGSRDTPNIGEVRAVDETSATDGTPPNTRGGDTVNSNLPGPDNTTHGLIPTEVSQEGVGASLSPTGDVAMDCDAEISSREGHDGVEAKIMTREGKSSVSPCGAGDITITIPPKMEEEVQVRDEYVVEGSVTMAALEDEGPLGVEAIVQEEQGSIGQPTDSQLLRHDDGAPSIDANPPAAVVEGEESALGDVVVGGTVPDKLLREIAAVEGNVVASGSTPIADDTNAADEASATNGTQPQTRDGGTVDPSLSGPDDTMHGSILIELTPEGIDAALPSPEDIVVDGVAATLPREGRGGLEAQSTAKGVEHIVSAGGSEDDNTPLQQQGVEEAQVPDEHVAREGVTLEALEDEGLPGAEAIVQVEGADMGQPADGQPLQNEEGEPSIHAGLPPVVAEGGKSTVGDIVVGDVMPDARLVEASAFTSTDTLNTGKVHAADEASATDGTPPHTRGGDIVDPSSSGSNDTVDGQILMEVPLEGADIALSPTKDGAVDGAAATLPCKGHSGVEVQSTAKEGESSVQGCSPGDDIQHQMMEEVQVRDGNMVEETMTIPSPEKNGPLYVGGPVQEEDAGMEERTESRDFQNDAGAPSAATSPSVPVAKGAGSALGNVVVGDAVPDAIHGKAAKVEGIADASRDSLDTGEVNAADQPGLVDIAPPQTRGSDTVDMSLSGPDNTAHDSMAMEVQQGSVDIALPLKETVTVGSSGVALPNKEDADLEVESIYKVEASSVAGGDDTEVDITPTQQYMEKEAPVPDQQLAEDKVSVPAQEIETPLYVEGVEEREDAKETTNLQPLQGDTGASSTEAHPLAAVEVGDEYPEGGVEVGDVVTDDIPGGDAEVEDTTNTRSDSHDTDDIQAADNRVGVACVPPQPRLSDAADPRVSAPSDTAHYSMALGVQQKCVDATQPTTEAVEVGDADVVLLGTEDINEGLTEDIMAKEGGVKVRDETQLEDIGRVPGLETETETALYMGRIVQDEGAGIEERTEDGPFLNDAGMSSIEMHPPVAVVTDEANATSSAPSHTRGSNAVDPNLPGLDNTAQDSATMEAQPESAGVAMPSTENVAVDGAYTILASKGKGGVKVESTAEITESCVSGGDFEIDDTPTLPQMEEEVQVRDGYLMEDSVSVPALEMETPTGVDLIVREEEADMGDPTDGQPLQYDAGVPSTKVDAPVTAAQGVEPVVGDDVVKYSVFEDISKEAENVDGIVDGSRDTLNIGDMHVSDEADPDVAVLPRVTHGSGTVDPSLSGPDDAAQPSMSMPIQPENVDTALPTTEDVSVNGADIALRVGENDGVEVESEIETAASRVSGGNIEANSAGRPSIETNILAHMAEHGEPAVGNGVVAEDVPDDASQDIAIVEDVVDVSKDTRNVDDIHAPDDADPVDGGPPQTRSHDTVDPSVSEPDDTGHGSIPIEVQPQGADAALPPTEDVAVHDATATPSREGYGEVVKESTGKDENSHVSGSDSWYDTKPTSQKMVGESQPEDKHLLEDSVSAPALEKESPLYAGPIQENIVDTRDTTDDQRRQNNEGMLSVEAYPPVAAAERAESGVSNIIAGDAVVEDVPREKAEVGGNTNPSRDILVVNDIYRAAEGGLVDGAPPLTREADNVDSTLPGPPVAVAEGADSAVVDVVEAELAPESIPEEAVEAGGIANESRDANNIGDVNAPDEASAIDDTPPHTHRSDTVIASLSEPDNTAGGLISMEVQPEGVDTILKPPEDAAVVGITAALPSDGNDGVMVESMAEEDEVSVARGDFDTKVASSLQQAVEKVKPRNERLVEEVVSVPTLEQEAPPDVEAIVQAEGTDLIKPAGGQPLQNDADVASVELDTPADVNEGEESAMGGVVVGDAKNIPGEVEDVEGGVLASSDPLNIDGVHAADGYGPTDVAFAQNRVDSIVDSKLSGPDAPQQDALVMDVQPGSVGVVMPSIDGVAANGDAAAASIETAFAIEALTTVAKGDLPSSGGGSEDGIDSVRQQTVQDVQARDKHLIGDDGSVSALEANTPLHMEGCPQEGGADMTELMTEQPLSNAAGAPSNEGHLVVSVVEGAQPIVGDVVVRDTASDDTPGEVAEIEGIVDAGRDIIAIDEIPTATEAGPVGSEPPQTFSNITVGPKLSGPGDPAHDLMGVEVQSESVDATLPLKDDVLMDGTAAILPKEGDGGVEAERIAKEGGLPVPSGDSDDGMPFTQQQVMKEVQLRDKNLVEDAVSMPPLEKEEQPSVNGVVEEDTEDTRELTDGKSLHHDAGAPSNEASPALDVAEGAESAAVQVVIGDTAPENLPAEDQGVEDIIDAKIVTSNAGNIQTAHEVGPTDGAPGSSSVGKVDATCETDQNEIPCTDSPATVDVGGLPAGALNGEVDDSYGVNQDNTDGSGAELGRQTTKLATQNIERNSHIAPDITPTPLGSTKVDGNNNTTEHADTPEKDRLCSRPDFVVPSSPIDTNSKGTFQDASDGVRAVEDNAPVDFAREAATVSSEGAFSMREINDRQGDGPATSGLPQSIDIDCGHDENLLERNNDDGESICFDLSVSEADESAYERELENLPSTNEESDEGAAVGLLSTDPTIKLGDSAATTNSGEDGVRKEETVVVANVAARGEVRDAVEVGYHAAKDETKSRGETGVAQASRPPQMDTMEESAPGASTITENTNPFAGVSLSEEEEVRGDMFVDDSSAVDRVPSNDDEVSPQPLMGPLAEIGANDSPASGQPTVKTSQEVEPEANVRKKEAFVQDLSLNSPNMAGEAISVGPAFEELTRESKDSGSVAMQPLDDGRHKPEEEPATDSSGRVLPAPAGHRTGSGDPDSVNVIATSSTVAGQNGTDDVVSPDKPDDQPPALGESPEPSSTIQDQNEGAVYSASATKSQLPGDTANDTIVVEMAESPIDAHQQEAKGAETLAGEEGVGEEGREQHSQASIGEKQENDEAEVETGSDETGAIVAAGIVADSQQQLLGNVEEVETKGEVRVGDEILETGGNAVVVSNDEQSLRTKDQENVRATTLAGKYEEQPDRCAAEKVVHVPNKEGNKVGTDVDQLTGSLKVDSTCPKESTQDVDEAVAIYDKEGGGLGGKLLDASAGEEKVGEIGTALHASEVKVRVGRQGGRGGDAYRSERRRSFTILPARYGNDRVSPTALP